MGEQRSRRTGNQPAIDLIDTTQSRGLSAAPQTSPRKTRSERHRKSERRRERRKCKKISGTKHKYCSRERSPGKKSNPRVNPIFVWVRQEDTFIVDVKCEDYDKRNRILLTKTAQGWRAIPRTETLVPNLKEAADDRSSHHRLHHKSKRSNKVKRKCAAVQVGDDNMQETGVTCDLQNSPSWAAPVNIESHLPSHTIHISTDKCLSNEQTLKMDISSVNSEVDCSAQSQTADCSAGKHSDVTPLDNLLAVAELEFNQQLQSGEWSKPTNLVDAEDRVSNCTIKSLSEIADDTKEYIDDMVHLNQFLDSCSNEDGQNSQISQTELASAQKIEDCDYTEEEENNLSMDDILSRLEQSLRSPEPNDLNDYADEDVAGHESSEEPHVCQEIDQNVYQEDSKCEAEATEPHYENETTEAIVESSTASDVIDESPTDLSVTKEKEAQPTGCDDSGPTDLSIPKRKTFSPFRPLTPRSPSQGSETVQSPQPSGIPAVPPSPDVLQQANNKKPPCLESLLGSPVQKNQSDSDNTTFEAMELDKCRKSASPTVSCSEEAKSNKQETNLEPPVKKFKGEDITLKTLLDPHLTGIVNKEEQSETSTETQKLLQLLACDTEVDPVTQLRQVLADRSLNVPDPMLVPKERLSQLLSSPAKEIPCLLKEHPELRLPEALAFPHILQDPDILVITLSQLEIIIQKQSQPLPLKTLDANNVTSEETNKPAPNSRGRDNCSFKSPAANDRLASTSQRKDNPPRSTITELANDIDAATNAAFNQMMWLPYLNHIENSSGIGPNSDFLKMIGNILPVYPGQMSDMTPLFNPGRMGLPLGFPLQQPPSYAAFEYSMWQEAMLQANALRTRTNFDMFNTRGECKDYPEKLNLTGSSRKPGLNNKMNALFAKGNPMQMQFPFPRTSSNQHPQPSYTDMRGLYPHTNVSQNIQIPHYNPPALANKFSTQRRGSHSSMNSKAQHSKYDQTQQLLKMHQNQSRYHQKTDVYSASVQNSSNTGKQKSSDYKALAGIDYHQNALLKEISRKTDGDIGKQQPIDLSGSTNSKSTLKARQHLVDQLNAPRLSKCDDAAEVGSTTASIEDMQESQKHLWHPLFGK